MKKLILLMLCNFIVCCNQPRDFRENPCISTGHMGPKDTGKTAEEFLKEVMPKIMSQKTNSKLIGTSSVYQIQKREVVTDEDKTTECLVHLLWCLYDLQRANDSWSLFEQPDENIIIIFFRNTLSRTKIYSSSSYPLQIILFVQTDINRNNYKNNSNLIDPDELFLHSKVVFDPRKKQDNTVKVFMYNQNTNPVMGGNIDFPLPDRTIYLYEIINLYYCLMQIIRSKGLKIPEEFITEENLINIMPLLEERCPGLQSYVDANRFFMTKEELQQALR